MAVRRGVWLVVALLFVAFMISAAGLVFTAADGRPRARRSPATPRSLLKVSGDLQEIEPGGVLGQFFEPPPTVRSLVDALRKAKVDRRVTSVSSGRPARRRSGARSRRCATRSSTSGRRASRSSRILEYGGEQEYYLASACDKVFLMPTASLDLTGIASYELFLRGTLDKIGAYPDVAAHRRLQDRGEHLHGAHLSRRRTARWRSRSTPISTSSWCGGSPRAGTSRKQEVRALIDHGPFLPEDAVRAGLVDDLAYEDELDDKVAARTAARSRFSRQDDYRHVSAGVARPQPRAAHRGDLRGRHDQQRREQLRLADRAGRRLRHASSSYLRKARADNSIKAIVLRIDSPADRRSRPT